MQRGISKYTLSTWNTDWIMEYSIYLLEVMLENMGKSWPIIHISSMPLLFPEPAILGKEREALG